ncbi:uncharacterized protein V1516DRAFT_676330 [Lipomyces oligophaga]|uniref:uncharacterized protein n=1 Tax=Lipomyces oligophaga TaxID=45792 RepID=UPI0034CE259A
MCLPIFIRKAEPNSSDIESDAQSYTQDAQLQKFSKSTFQAYLKEYKYSLRALPTLSQLLIRISILCCCIVILGISAANLAKRIYGAQAAWIFSIVVSVLGIGLSVVIPLRLGITCLQHIFLVDLIYAVLCLAQLGTGFRYAVTPAPCGDETSVEGESTAEVVLWLQEHACQSMIVLVGFELAILLLVGAVAMINVTLAYERNVLVWRPVQDDFRQVRAVQNFDDIRDVPEII